MYCTHARCGRFCKHLPISNHSFCKHLPISGLDLLDFFAGAFGFRDRDDPGLQVLRDLVVV